MRLFATNCVHILLLLDEELDCHDRMDYLIKAIFGKRALGQLSASDYVDWAGEMLVKDYDSYSLRILAGLDRFASTYEADDYFLRSVKELNLSVPDSETAIRVYACEIAQRIIEDKITAQQGVRALFLICIAIEYERNFIVWFELDDALASLLAGYYPFTYESATLDNFDEIVKQEAEKFIASSCSNLQSNNSIQPTVK
jgi:hypothetical protein